MPIKESLVARRFNPMTARLNCSIPSQGRFPGGEAALLEAILDGLDLSALAEHMTWHRRNGRPGYPARVMLRAYAASFVLDLDSTNALIRLLRRDAAIRAVCGFEGEALPCRRTFNLFVRWLSLHPELVDGMQAALIDRLREHLHDLGRMVAIDSTNVRTHANHRRDSDPEAGWGVKHSPRTRKGDTEYFYGYKVHMVADANHELPLAMVVTPGNRNDTLLLPAVMDRAAGMYPWWGPGVAIADRGYDSYANHHWLDTRGIAAVIHIRKATAHDKLYDGVYTKGGVPVCLGQIPMEYALTDPNTGHHLYICPEGGCHLKEGGRGGITYCDSEVWEDPQGNLRVKGGRVRRDSEEWRAYYQKRQGIERVFKRMKESRRLERHYTRGRAMITLHAMMSALICLATTLARLRAGANPKDMLWQRDRVA